MQVSILSQPGTRRTGLFTFAALAALFGVFALAGTSKAAPVDHDITFDHGRLTLGAVFPDNTIIPAPVAQPDCISLPGGSNPATCGPSPLSPLVPNYPDGNAHVKVTVDGSTATVSAANFKTPMTYVDKPGDPNTKVPIKTTAPNGLTGTWDAGTGALSLTGDLRIGVATGATGNTPADISWCQIDAPSVTWSTGLNAVTPGIPFDSPQGLDGNGAISASWADLPNGVSINGGDCSTVNAVVHDTGAIWFGAGEATPPPPPVCEPPLEGLWPDCVAPPVTREARITAVRVMPRHRTIRAGRNLQMRVRVVNRGNLGTRVRVRLRLNRHRGVRLVRSFSIWVRPDAANTRRVTLHTNRRARGRYRVIARGAGKSSRAVVRVRARR